MSQLLDGAKEWFHDFLDRRLPERTKRSIFAASFCGRLKESPVFDNQTLNKLNTLLALGNSDTSLKLAVNLSKVIWHGQSAQDICGENVSEGSFSKERSQQVARRVISAMPRWLRYGDDARIEQDVEKLLGNRSTVLEI